MLGELAAIAAAFCFAVAAIIYRKPLSSTSAASASILRFAGTGLILVMTSILIGGVEIYLTLPVEALLLALTSGVVGLSFGDVLYMTSFKQAGVARTVSVVATYPLFSLGIEYIIGGRLIPLFAVFGAFLIFVGVWVLAHSRNEKDELYSPSSIRRGVIAALITAFLYSISMLLIDMSLDALPVDEIEGAFAVNSLRTVAGGMSLLLLVPLIDSNHGFLKISRNNMALLLLGSIVAYGMGWYLLTLGFLFAPTAFVVPLSSITPLFASILAIQFLKERLTLRCILGVFVILAGVLMIVIS